MAAVWKRKYLLRQLATTDAKKHWPQGVIFMTLFIGLIDYEQINFNYEMTGCDKCFAIEDLLLGWSASVSFPM